MQAENALDQMDWVEKITGVIASLLSSDALERVNAKKVYICMLPLIHIFVVMIEPNSMSASLWFFNWKQRSTAC